MNFAQWMSITSYWLTGTNGDPDWLSRFEQPVKSLAEVAWEDGFWEGKRDAERTYGFREGDEEY